jgi:hypothetical protein
MTYPQQPSDGLLSSGLPSPYVGEGPDRPTVCCLLNSPPPYVGEG